MRGGWPALVLLLVAFLFIPSVPVVQPFVPIAQTAVLLFPAIAVCALLGWAAGGSASLAVAWVGVGAAALVLLPGIGVSPALATVQRGWALVCVALFGLVSAASLGSTPFFVRAMSGLLLALAIVAIIVALTGNQGPKLPLPHAQMAPALLSLESLAALTLAWAVYHRVARVPIGAPLSTWHQFRFSDRYMWALVAGVIFLIFPAFATVRALGLNLVVFFGTLYAVRLTGMMAYRCYTAVYPSRLRAG